MADRNRSIAWRRRASFHGMHGTATHRSWAHMLERCNNQRCRQYAYYGARGIRVCDQWKSFAGFFADMGVRPEGTTLDRIDSEGNYEPGNCRWATHREQMGNRRDNRMITSGGITQCVRAWERTIGVRHGTIHARIKRGLTVEQCLAAIS